MKKIKIYLIARISPDAHSWNNKIAGLLNREKIEIFMPHEHNPWNQKHESFAMEVYEEDLKAIKNSHIGLCLPEFGNDCSWECGWYSNSKKPLVVFINDQINWLRDWMVKGGVDYILTDNQTTFEKIKKDPILKNKKIFLINENLSLTMAMENIYSLHYEKILNTIANLRPYSWVDLVFVGYLAKTIALGGLNFALSDLWFIIALLAMWFFYNSLLEKKHDYDFRAGHKIFITLISATIPVIIATLKPLSLIFVVLAFGLNYLYLQKQSLPQLRLVSIIIRGFIHSNYFLFTIFFFSAQKSENLIFYTIMLFSIMCIRSLIGDLRDIKHNADKGKKTLAVILGQEKSFMLISITLIMLFSLNLIMFNNLQILLPFLIFFLAMLIYQNWYVQHQLSVIWTMFVTLNYIGIISGVNLIIINLIFTGLTLNMVFYPFLKRESNPIYK